MKATKLILAIAFFAFSTLAFSQAERPDSNEPVPIQLSAKISLKIAMENPALSKAIHAQVNPRELLRNDQEIYIAKVEYRHVTYAVFGTLNEWKYFFSGLNTNDVPK